MDSYYFMPIGSIYSRPESKSIGYLDIISNLPQAIKNLIISPKTSSYVRGLSKSYDIPEDQAPFIAFAILEIAIGKKAFAQLPAILSTELQLPNDKAQKMAAEIEKDVFGPVRTELDEFLREQKKRSESIVGKLTSNTQNISGPTSPGGYEGRSRRGNGSQLQNILNLKELPAKKPQASLPPRPVQKDLPTRPSLAPHPYPLPEQERGTTPKPPNKPIRFT